MEPDQVFISTLLFLLLSIVTIIFTKCLVGLSGIVIACVYLCVCPTMCQSRVFPYSNSSPIQVRNPQFGQEV